MYSPGLLLFVNASVLIQAQHRVTAVNDVRLHANT